MNGLVGLGVGVLRLVMATAWEFSISTRFLWATRQTTEAGYQSYR